MRHPPIQRLVGRSRVLRGLSIGLLARLELVILSGHKDQHMLHVIRQARRERESLLTGNEAFLLYALARAQSRLEGDMAEVGVFEGASARLLSESKGERVLHLFDTFEGLPEPGDDERRILRRHQFAASLPRVRDYLAHYPSIQIHPGWFPQSAGAVRGRRFSLVHLDVDLYASMLAALEFFYPRLVPGGMILAHDYSILPGVQAAVDTFTKARAAQLLELPTTQVIILRC